MHELITSRWRAGFTQAETLDLLHRFFIYSGQLWYLYRSDFPLLSFFLSLFMLLSGLQATSNRNRRGRSLIRALTGPLYQPLSVIHGHRFVSIGLPPDSAYRDSLDVATSLPHLCHFISSQMTVVPISRPPLPYEGLIAVRVFHFPLKAFIFQARIAIIAYHTRRVEGPEPFMRGLSSLMAPFRDNVVFGWPRSAKKFSVRNHNFCITSFETCLNHKVLSVTHPSPRLWLFEPCNIPGGELAGFGERLLACIGAIGVHE